MTVKPLLRTTRVFFALAALNVMTACVHGQKPAISRPDQLDIYGVIGSPESLRNAKLITVTLAINENGHAQIRWESSSEKEPSRYNVYRSFFPGRLHEQVNSTYLKDTAFVDSATTYGGARYYLIEAVGGDGKTIGLSKEIKIASPSSPFGVGAPDSGFQYPPDNFRVDGVKLKAILDKSWSSFSNEDRQQAEKLIRFFEVMNDQIAKIYHSLNSYPLRCSSMATLVGMLLKETIGLKVKLATGVYKGNSSFDNQNYLIFTIGTRSFVLDWAADCFQNGASPAVLPVDQLTANGRFYMYQAQQLNLKEIYPFDLSRNSIDNDIVRPYQELRAFYEVKSKELWPYGHSIS